MKRWWSRSKKGLGKGSNQTRQPDIAASTTDDGFEMEVQLEKRDAPEELEFDEREEEQDASDYFKSFLHGSHKVEGHQQHSESESYDPYNVEPMPPSMDYPDDEGTIESQCNENNSNVQDDEDAQLVFVPTMTNINDDHENGDESPLSTSPSSIKYWA